jgi:cytochrome c oxidase cbb3-type subunit I/II
MPNYPWLFDAPTDVASLESKIAVQQALGVPIKERTAQEIASSVAIQGRAIADDLKAAGVEARPETEIVALIAYLQKLGKSEPVAPKGGGHGPKTAQH